MLALGILARLEVLDTGSISDSSGIVETFESFRASGSGAALDSTGKFSAAVSGMLSGVEEGGEDKREDGPFIPYPMVPPGLLDCSLGFASCGLLALFGALRGGAECSGWEVWAS